MKKIAVIILTLAVIKANAQGKAKTEKGKSSYPGYKFENGVYAKFYKRTVNSVKAKEGDVVKVVLTYKNSKDSLLFDSKQNPNGTNALEFPLSKSAFKGSFEDALSIMSAGDSASFKINADSIFLKSFKVSAVPPFVEKGSMLTFEVKLEKITSKETAEKERIQKEEEQKTLMATRKAEEPTIFAKYLEDNKISEKPTPSGLYYVSKVKGTGAKPTTGCTVKVNYTGRLLDGTIFDTSDGTIAKSAGLYDDRRPYQPIEFPLGQGQVISGWDEGIALMSVGEKGTLIIPSVIGYGETGAGPIPPYAPLVFDVELISFTPAQ
jgi:FKBP-type peptidyl-prolyl cis-trans isomerase FkpA